MASISDPLAGCWYAVATSDAVENDPYPIEVRDVAYVLWRGTGRGAHRHDRPLHPSRGQALPRHRHRRLPPMPLPRLDVRRRRTVRQRSVIGPACNHRTRCPSESASRSPSSMDSSGSAQVNRHTAHSVPRGRRQPLVHTPQHLDGGLELLSDTHDRQHARRGALSVHARRNVRTRAGTNRPEVHTRATRRHVLRLCLLSHRQQRRRGEVDVGWRRRHHPTRHVDRIRPPVLSAQHHVILERHRTDPVHDRVPHQ